MNHALAIFPIMTAAAPGSHGLQITKQSQQQMLML